MSVIGQFRGGFRDIARVSPHAPVSSAATEPTPSPSAFATPAVDDGTRLRAMVDAHFDFVWRAVRGLGVLAADADDAAQQVFLVASRKLAVIAPGSERSFLFATARGIAANARRARTRRREDVDGDALVRELDDRPNPEEIAASREAGRLLDAMLDRMPEDLRTVFVLFELEGETAAAIATMLGIPAGTAASRLRRAREWFEAEAARVRSNDHAAKGGSR